MPYYEDPLDDPYSRECDFLDLEEDTEDPDDEPLPFNRKSNLYIKPISEKSKPTIIREEPEKSSTQPEPDFSMEPFWTDSYGKILIHDLQFYRFLQAQGFFRIGYTDSFAKVENGTYEEVNPIYMRDFTKEYLLSRGMDKVFEAVHLKAKNLFSTSALVSIDKRDISYIKDTKCYAAGPMAEG
jgi:hypothetical protein